MYKKNIFSLTSFILGFIISYYYSSKINYIFFIYLIITFFIFYTIFLTIDSSYEHFLIQKFKDKVICHTEREGEDKNQNKNKKNEKIDNESSSSNCNKNTISIDKNGPPLIQHEKLCVDKKKISTLN
jgi:hypothetical protein